MFNFIGNVLLLVVAIKGFRWVISLIKGNGRNSYYDYNHRDYCGYREEPTRFIGSGSSEKSEENKWDNLFKG